MLAESHYWFNKAADVLDLPEKIRTILLTPRRTIKVELAIRRVGRAALARTHIRQELNF